MLWAVPVERLNLDYIGALNDVFASGLVRRSGFAPPASLRAYWRRLPYLSCSAFSKGVKTSDPKFCGIPFSLSDQKPYRCTFFSKKLWM